MRARLRNRIALITGASRGIGRAIACAYAREGAHVLLLARTVGGLEEADEEVRELGGSATLVPLDLKDGEGIDRLGASIYERWGRLDILVSNAGILGPITPLGHISPAEWQELLAVNVTANWRLIRSLDPLLRRSKAGRAIFVTSGAAQSCRAFWGGYSVSKAALEALVKTYAHECSSTAIRVNLVNPGATRTGMRAQAIPGEDPEDLPAPDMVTEIFVELGSDKETRHGQTLQARPSGENISAGHVSAHYSET
jgi:NAD(P)-dependent dehydrogenase (short-subunit alcohol dehydrogenase family)